MTVATSKGRAVLSNAEELHVKRGVTVKMLYNIDDHRYIGADKKLHYKPYVRGAKV